MAKNTPQKHHKKGGAAKVFLILLLIVLLAAGAAAFWWWSVGGDVTALPEPLRTLWAEHQPRPGATFV